MRMSWSEGSRLALSTGPLNISYPDDDMSLSSGTFSGSDVTMRIVPLKIYRLSSIVHPKGRID